MLNSVLTISVTGQYFFLRSCLFAFRSFSHSQTLVLSFFLPWWVFCRSALCRSLLTSSRNFLFPLTHPLTVTFILIHFHKMLYLLPQIVYIHKSTVKYNLFIDQQERGMQTFLLKAFPLHCFSLRMFFLTY